MIETIKLNLIPDGEKPTIHCSQYDDGRQFKIELYEGEEVYTPANVAIELRVRKVDNKLVVVECEDITDNVLTFVISEQMSACFGKNCAELCLIGDTTLSTLAFFIEVQKDVSQGGVTSQSDIDNLTTQIERIAAETVPAIVTPIVEEIAPEVIQGIIGDDYYTKDQTDENFYNKGQVDDLLDSVKVPINSATDLIVDGDLIHPTLEFGTDVATYYVKVGCVVYVHILANVSSHTSYTTFFTLPEGYRPWSTNYFHLGRWNNTYASFDSGNSIKINKYGDVSIRAGNSTDIFADFCFVAAN